jgi:hypothetical protein
MFRSRYSRPSTQIDLIESNSIKTKRSGVSPCDFARLGKTIQSGRGVNFIVVLLVSALFCASVLPAYAGTGSVTVLPLAGGNPTGLQVEIDTRWVTGNGYRPIRLTVKTSQGQVSATDRKLQIEMAFRYVDYTGNRPIKDEVVSTYVTLSEGKSQVQHTIRMLQRAKWNTVEFRVYEEGILRQDISANVDLSVQRNFFRWGEGSPRMMVISSDAAKFSDTLPAYSTDAAERTIPDLRILATLFPGSMYFGIADFNTTADPINNEEAAGIIESWQNSLLIHPEDVPTEFNDYSCFEWIIVSRDDLVKLQKEHPEKWHAIRTRIAAGGALLVYDVDPAQSAAHPLGMPPSNQSLEVIDDNLLADASVHLQSANWMRHQGYQPSGVGIPGFSANISVFGRSVQARTELRFTPLKLTSPINVRSNRARKNFPCLLSNQNAEVQEMQSHGIDPGTASNQVRFDRPYVTRRAGMGMVVAFSGDPFPGRTYHWVTIISRMTHEQWSWRSQTGISLNEINGDFWTLFIPGVGTAPVISFLVLISLFAFAIGPINYFVLRHFERLHLILVTVPAGALLVIVSLLAYAFFSEGFGVRARARSVTILDQENETAVGWARQNYYAGLGSGRSLSFEKDTTVYPVHFYPNRPGYDEPKRQVYWEDKQYFESGFLETRAQAQFLLSRANKSTAKLEVSKSNGRIQVTNKLGSRVLLLFLTDDLGTVHAGEEIENDAIATLRTATTAERAEVLRDISGENTPEFPIGFQAKLYRTNRDEHCFSPHEPDSMIPRPSMKSNTLEKFISETMFQSGGERGRQAYIAVVEKAVQIPLANGVEGENGFHVVVGTYE